MVVKLILNWIEKNR